MKGINWPKLSDQAVTVVGVAMVLYHMLYSIIHWQTALLHQNTHLGFALVMIFLYTMGKKSGTWDLKPIFAVLAIAVAVYMHVNYDALQWRLALPTNIDLIVGIVLVVLVFEATRESYGWFLPGVVMVFVLYEFFGQYLPQPFWHYPFRFEEIISSFATNFTGIYGSLLGISAYYIFMFVIYGALLQASGGVGFFKEIGKLFSRKFAAGVAMSSVVTSAMVGTITGSVAANVTITGSFTIPAMKRSGFPNARAGAVEAVASTGGQIMPPVMGAAAFIMASLLGIPYIQIAAMAAIPAIFYFLSVGIGIQLFAVKTGLKPVHEEINKSALWSGAPIFFLPLALLIWMMAVGYTPMYSIFYTNVALIGVALIIMIFRKEMRQPIGVWIDQIKKAAVSGSQIAVIMALCGVMLVTVTSTGLGMKIPAIVEDVSGGNLVIAYLVTAVAAIIIGTGVATTAAYLLVALLAVPALTRLGMSPVVAHFFVFFFACFSFITPPVAPAAFVASVLARSKYMDTAIEACKLGAGAFILPFMVIWVPATLLIIDSVPWAIAGIIGSLLLLINTQIAVVGQFFTRLTANERIISVATTAILVFGLATHNYAVLFAGFAAFVILTVWDLRRRAVARELQPAVQLSP